MVPFRVRFWLFCTLGGLALARFGRNSSFKAEICKKYSCIDTGTKFRANFRMQTIFPRPGGGTIAAGNRDSPPGRAQPARGACWRSECLRVIFLHAPFPFQQVSFLQVSFPAGRFLQYACFLGGFHPGSPLPPLVGRFLVTFWRTFAHFWLKLGVLFFVLFFGSVFGRFLMSLWG